MRGAALQLEIFVGEILGKIADKVGQSQGLPDWLTFAARRHGGVTELGNAELTESSMIALSGHRTAEAARGYIKPTEVQRESGLLKRRAWVQAVAEGGAAENKKETFVGMEPLPGRRNESC